MEKREEHQRENTFRGEKTFGRHFLEGEHFNEKHFLWEEHFEENTFFGKNTLGRTLFERRTLWGEHFFLLMQLFLGERRTREPTVPPTSPPKHLFNCFRRGLTYVF